MRDPVDLTLALACAAFAIYLIRGTLSEARTGKADPWLLVGVSPFDRDTSPRMFKVRQATLWMQVLLFLLGAFGLGAHWLGLI